MEDLLNQQLAELEVNLNGLKSSVEYIGQAENNAKEITESALKVVKSINEIQTEYITLKSATQKLLKKIDDIDFPSRLDKLDVTVATINKNITNIQGRLEKIYNDLDDKIKDSKDIVISNIKESNKKILNTLASIHTTLIEHSKEFKFLKIFSIVSSSIFLILLFLIIYKLYLV